MFGASFAVAHLRADRKSRAGTEVLYSLGRSVFFPSIRSFFFNAESTNIDCWFVVAWLVTSAFSERLIIPCPAPCARFTGEGGFIALVILYIFFMGGAVIGPIEA